MEKSCLTESNSSQQLSLAESDSYLSQQTTINHLPPEIITYILSFALDNMANCSLVSRTWNEISKVHQSDQLWKPIDVIRERLISNKVSRDEVSGVNDIDDPFSKYSALNDLEHLHNLEIVMIRLLKKYQDTVKCMMLQDDNIDSSFYHDHFGSNSIYEGINYCNHYNLSDYIFPHLNYNTKSTKQKIEFIRQEIAKMDNLLAIEELDLKESFLTALPPEIFLLSKLKRLDLEGNQVQRIPPEICHLKELETLLFDSNKIESLPDEIGNLTNLKEIRASYNPLESLPLEVMKLKKLEKLCLKGTPLTKQDPRILKTKNKAIKENVDLLKRANEIVKRAKMEEKRANETVKRAKMKEKRAKKEATLKNNDSKECTIQ